MNQCVPKNNITSDGRRERTDGGRTLMIHILKISRVRLKSSYKSCKTNEPVLGIEMDYANKFSLIF